MTREQYIELLMLLSALESWAFPMKPAMPNYLHNCLLANIELLRAEVLK